MVKMDIDASYQSGEEFEEESQIAKKITRNRGNNWIYIAVILSFCFVSAGVVATVLLLTKPASSDNASTYAPRNSVSEKTSSSHELYMCGITLMEYQPSVPGDNIFSPHLHNIGEFNRPLECNFHMLSGLQGGATCCETTLSSIIASANAGAEILIPCGVCVVVDMASKETVDLPGGLQIEGMLYFPPSADVTIRTTHVIVLGTLKIDTPDIDKLVTFSLYGEDDAIFENTAGHSSLELCSSLCNFGPKAIAVVGGRLEIKGADPSCPAWEKLKAVSASRLSSLAPGPAPVVSYPCGDGNILTNSDFEQGILSWIGYGNPHDIVVPGYDDVGTAIIATGRNDWSAGIYQSLNLTCLAKSQTWQVSAKVKLYNETTGNPVLCDIDVPMDCPLVRFYYRVGTDGHYFYEYYDTDMIWREGNWNDLNVTVGIQLDETAEVGIMICGGPIGAVLEVDDVAMIPIQGVMPEEIQEAERNDSINQLLVSAEAANCWGPGTELLLTSHTRSDLDRQVVSVQSVDIEMRTITLNQTIVKPVTLQDHDDFAIEVASLTRRVVFEADSNPADDLIGGHMIIYGTPNPQHLEGVEIRNFGQQGRLGRYPTHFHFCGNSTASVITKNVVRESNQRCYVIHGTNEVIVKENVAFNSFGHCFFLENGDEVNNVFTRNLGAGVKKATKLVSEESGRTETDDQPSVYWISNPSNFFDGNVAAGGEHSGYWFETPGERQLLNLGAFDNNEAHSMENFGFTVYPPGWQPTQVATIRNIKVFRNQHTGMFLHNTRRLNFIGGVLADNGSQSVYVLQGDDIKFTGTKIIGVSSAFVSTPNQCEQVIGMVLHATKQQEFDLAGTVTGTTLIDVQFVNFTEDETGCNRSSPFEFSSTSMYYPTFDSTHSFINVSLDEGSNPIDACLLNETFGLDDIIMEIVDDPSGSFSDTKQPGFLVSRNLALFANGPCSKYSGCLDFCENACMRTVRFLTNPVADDYVMVVTDGVNTLSLTRNLRLDDPFQLSSDGIYNVALPPGSFDVHFEDRSGAVGFPDYAIAVFEAAPFCSNHIEHGDITVHRPAPNSSICGSDLVKNGGFDVDISHWQDISSGIVWDRSSGSGQGGALRSTVRENLANSFWQWLNVNCVIEGNTYRFALSFKLIDSAGSPYTLNCDTESCPNIGLMAYHFDPETGVLTKDSQISVASTISPTQDSDGFLTVSGSWTPSAEEAAADKLGMTFNVYQGNVQYIVDNVVATSN